MTNDDKYLTIKEAATHLNVHWQTIRNYIKQGRLKAASVNRTVRIALSELEKLNPAYEGQPKEVELRFVVKTRERTETNLMKLKAVVLGQMRVTDHWYAPKETKNIFEKNDFFDTGKGFGLRIREIDNGYTGRVQTTLEVKRLAVPFDHSTCIEKELEAANYRDTDELLRLMNYKEFVVLKKDRKVFKYKDVKISIDDVEDFGVGVEVEQITAEDPEKVKKHLLKIAKEIGIDPEKETADQSLTFMVMNKSAKF